MFQTIMNNTAEQTPLVHAITNYVTVNDTANMILAAGGSPIMADAADETEEITSICSSLVLNIGTINERTAASMVLSGKKANEMGIPVILDPVGAGASSYRMQVVETLLKEIQFAVIRGNLSEIKTIYSGAGSSKGVDVLPADLEQEDSGIELAQNLSRQTRSVVLITGRTDIAADKNKVCLIHNGNPLMSKVTGTGCMLTGIIGAYCGANPKRILDSTAAAAAVMGVSGELAYQRMMKEKGGTSSFRMHIIDTVSMISHVELEEAARFESR